MEFYFPTELGEQLAFTGAAATAVIGLFVLVFPATVLRLSAFHIGGIRPEGYASVRSIGAQYLGLGLLPILLAQDWLYMALGIALAFAAMGRLLACILDRALTPRNILILLLEVVLSAGPLAYVFGYL